MNFIVTQIKKSSLVQYSLADRTVQFICIPDKNWYLTSFKPAEQLSLNNQRRFTLVKAIKLHSEVEKRKIENFVY